MRRASGARPLGVAAEAIVAIVAVLLGWQLLSSAGLLPAAAVPGPVAIGRQFWPDRALYGHAVLATLQPVTLGLLIGEAGALAVGAAFVLSPRAERVLRGIGVVLYALPPITLTPLLSVLLQGEAPQVILAVIGVYFPALTATLVGLRQIDRRSADLVTLYGGNPLQLLWLVRVRAAMPTIAAGLRMGAPAAVLGAILGEFGGGRPGLGAMLLSTMGAGNPARSWGVALVATLLSIGLYGLFSLGAARFRRGAVPSLLALSRGLQDSSGAAHGAARVASGTLLAVAVPLLIWQALPWLFGISPILFRTPLGVLRYLLGPDGADARQTLWQASGVSLPLAGAGLAGGLALALLAALAISLQARAERLVMPPLLFLQSVPLVVLIPAIVLMAGRGAGATLLVAMLVTFFPAMIVIAEGLRLMPAAPRDMLRLYGAGRLAVIRHLTLPAALPYLFAAARIVAPGALLGVMVAEWLATGVGLGDLLNEARSTLDFGMIWSVALVTVLISTGFFVMVEAIEAALARSRAGRRPSGAAKA